MAARERSEFRILLGAVVLLALTLAFALIAGNVFRGDTRVFDERVIRALRRTDVPAIPIGPWWLHSAAPRSDGARSPTVLGLAVTVVIGYLFIYRLYRTGAFVLPASVGGWILNWAMKRAFDRPRPELVPHLQQVMTSSFPSGRRRCCLASRVSDARRATDQGSPKGDWRKFYCMAIAMLVYALVRFDDGAPPRCGYTMPPGSTSSTSKLSPLGGTICPLSCSSL